MSALTAALAVLTARLTGGAVNVAWRLARVEKLAGRRAPVSPVPSPHAALPSRAGAEPSWSQAGVRCLVLSCRRPGPHPDPATRRSSSREGDRQRWSLLRSRNFKHTVYNQARARRWPLGPRAVDRRAGASRQSSARRELRGSRARAAGVHETWAVEGEQRVLQTG